MTKRNPNRNSDFGSYRIAGIANGRQGLTLAPPLIHDLILTDAMMPKMRGQSKLADVPILVLSSKADDGCRIRLLQVGVHKYPIKPFRVDELLMRVTALIGERQHKGYRVREREHLNEAIFHWR